MSITDDVPEFGFFDFLGLPGCKTKARHLDEHLMAVRASYEVFPTLCPGCGGSSLRGTEPREIYFWDIPHVSHPSDKLSPTVVQLSVCDAACTNCGRLLPVRPEWLHPTRDMTVRLYRYLAERAAVQISFAQIALDTGQDDQTVIDIFLEVFGEWEEKQGKNLPLNSGIDEAHFSRGRVLTVIVDAEGGRGTVDVLPDRTNDTIEKRLRLAPNARDVEHQTQDYCAPFRNVATKPTGLFSAENTGSSEDGDQPLTETFSTPLYGDLPMVGITAPGQREYMVDHPEVAAPPLPGADPVGDHFHFSQKVVSGFKKVWAHVREHLEEFLYQAELGKFSDEQIARMGMDAVEAHATARAQQKFNKTKTLLWDYRFALRCSLERWLKLPVEAQEIIHGLLDTLPLLKEAFEIKNAGLDIFPRKPKKSRSKAALKAAAAQPSAEFIPLANVEEVALKLRKWTAMKKELKPFFVEARNIIKDWRPELLRIVTTGLNNARAEVKVGQLRTINRLARGQKFELLRARQLWMDARRRKQRWPANCDEIKGMITPRRYFDLLDQKLAEQG
jgi:transposase